MIQRSHSVVLKRLVSVKSASLPVVRFSTALILISLLISPPAFAYMVPGPIGFFAELLALGASFIIGLAFYVKNKWKKKSQEKKDS